ncbi:MAG: hypothetical protein KDD22_07415 [Bdellovibrionales bacterium]|nr:hypothetical protein [Bdellovibrionales bacterium]
MTVKFNLFLFTLVVGLASCTHSLHIAQVGDFSPTFKPLNQGRVISSKSEQFVVMGFVTDTNYVDQAYNDLLSQCSRGRIQGVVTQYSTSHGFFSWTNKIHLQGLCVR